MDYLSALLRSAGPTAVTWGFAFALMTALELVAPRERIPLRARAAGLVFWLIWLPVTGLVYTGFHALWDTIGLRPLITLPLRLQGAGWIAVVAAPLAAAFVGDFFFYWCHRAEHRWFWRYHAVHHSIRDLNAVNAYHHISEPLFQTVMIVLPTTLIVSDTGPVAPIMAMILFLQVFFIHSSSKLHLGPLRALFADNRFHRIHHSLEAKHFDKNFGAFTTLWDRLFGTAWMPAADEWPATGLAEIDQPRSVGEWLTLPGRYAAAAGPAAPELETTPARA